MKTFNVTTNRLEGRNLIEASAGTGKTYSIALLVIRLIVEKGIDIEKILMVTFTNAAVAELEGRIRKFIKKAHTYLTSDKPAGLSPEMKKILDDAMAMNGKEKVRKNLKRSLLFLDETSIYTIHSFCQRTLTEFAFETNQAFESELVSDTQTLVDEAVHKFWRERITIIDRRLLDPLNEMLSLSQLKKCVSNRFDMDFHPSSDKDTMADVITNFEKASLTCGEVWQKILNYYDDHKTMIIADAQSGGQKRSFSEIGSSKETFLEKYKVMFQDFKKKGKPGYMETFLPELSLLFQEFFSESDKCEEIIKKYYFSLVEEAIAYARKEIDNKKQQSRMLFYNDLITNLHEAVNGPNKDILINTLNNKYEAIFIDEFHDTDKEQYEIFYTLFGDHSIMFLIGDPKQSIYGWRGADLDTYKLAASQAEQFTMDRNFRSSEKYIEAMNALYASVDDPFQDDQIDYVEVQPGQDVGKLLKGTKDVVPLSLIYDKNKDDASAKVAWEINKLLTEEFYIDTREEHRRVRPSDIAVLVRKNHQSPGIKRNLTRLGIPAITYDDSEVLKSYEARSVFYILSAMLNPNKSNINRAVATVFTGKTNDDILNLDDELELERFKKLGETLGKNGVYGALMEFAKIYQVRKHSLEKENGERIISNFLQTAELCQQRETEKGQSPEQLLNWLQRISEGESAGGDEYLQRIESDENSVTIVTIHKSKGLAYNIVFAPFLNMKYEENKEPCYEEDTDKEQLKEEQENRRLMYVTLTRAVYKSYITLLSSKLGTIHDFEVGLISAGTDLVETIEVEEPKKRYKPEVEKGKASPRIFNGKIDQSWRILSFSGLSKSHTSFTTEEKEYDAPAYDEFVFNQLPRGIVAGLFLHEIFENIDFANQEYWEQEVAKVGNKYTIKIDDTDKNLYDQLINHVLHANYKAGPHLFHLSSLTSDKRIHELEFYFELNSFRTGELLNILENIGIDYNSFNGAMHGFVDLFFEMNGKYYILDWKSNYLGNVIEAYSPEKLDSAMTANNYHLQYLIYTIAVKRYLENKLPNFNYEKHFGGVFYTFLRGMRKGQESGIFYNKPGLELIQKIDEILG